MTTIYIHAPGVEHDLPGHPENAKRGPAAWDLLQTMGLFDHLQLEEPKPASMDQLRAVHTRDMLVYIEEVSLRGGGRVDQDTYATSDSFNLARLAAGAVCQAADKIVTAEADNGYVFVRPPGHHAEYQRPGGFCLVNNVAAGVRHVQQKHGLKKVAVIDFDVHHGNGTQDIFYEDPSCLFISSHQYGRFFYPGSGNYSETGIGPGEGQTMNLPLPIGVGDQGILEVYERCVVPKLTQFQPEMVFVSAGYDGHWVDPLANQEISLMGYAALSRMLIEWSRSHCNGKILFVQEGGYVLEALAHGVLNTLYALLGRDQIDDPLGQSSAAEPDLSSLVTSVRDIHLI